MHTGPQLCMVGIYMCLAFYGITHSPFWLHQLKGIVVLAAAEATPEVLDSNDSPLPELYPYPPGSGEAEEDSSANDTVVNSAGMQSMTSNVTAGDADAICRNNAFLLPLQLGQNSFSVAVAAPDPPEQASVHLCPPGACTMCLQQDCLFVKCCTGHGMLASTLSTLMLY